MGKVTIQTIARAARVSVGTVDRAINSRGRIKPDTKARILRIAEELGYTPNKIASALGRQRKFKIGVLIPRYPAFFFQYLRKGIEKAAGELADYGVIVEEMFTDWLDVAEQRAVLDSLAADAFDGIALVGSGDELAGSIDRLAHAGVPVVTFNSDVRASGRLFYVGEDAYKSGRLAGDMMGRLLGGKGKVAVFVSFYNPGASTNRRDGFRDMLRENYPDIEIICEREYRDVETIAYAAMEDVFKRYRCIDGLFSNSATGSVASGRFLSDLAPSHKPVVIGYDVTEEVEGYLERQVCDMIIDQDPRKQSYYGVRLLARHLIEKWTPARREQFIRVKLVMRGNASEHSMVRDLSGWILE